METILLAEDEPAVRKLVRDALEQLGYTVLPAADGYEALRILEGHSGVVHLLLTDVIMPLMSGPELVKRVQSAKPATKWFICPATPTTPWPLHRFSQLNNGFIQKPFNADRSGGEDPQGPVGR